MFCSLRPPLGLRRSACVATHIDIGSVFDSMVSLNRNSYLPHEHVKLEDFGSIVGGSFHFYLFPDPSLFFFQVSMSCSPWPAQWLLLLPHISVNQRPKDHWCLLGDDRSYSGDGGFEIVHSSQCIAEYGLRRLVDCCVNDEFCHISMVVISVAHTKR